VAAHLELMADYSKQREYNPRIFPVGLLAKALETVAKELGNVDEATISVSRRLPDGTTSDDSTNFGGIETLCEIGGEVDSVSLRPGNKGFFKGGTRHVLLLYHRKRFIVVVAGENPADLTKGFDILERELELTAFTGERRSVASDLRALFKRVEVLEEAVAPDKRKLTFFVSYRFDGGLAEQYGREIETFLTRLGVSVITGKAYEPSRISDKVKRRIHRGTDALVVIIDADATSEFCRDELTRAATLDVAVIPIKEKGAAFDPGIHADIEYIPFDRGHVSDAFLKLLEGVITLRHSERAEAERASDIDAM
jgi:hypothetical protein